MKQRTSNAGMNGFGRLLRFWGLLMTVGVPGLVSAQTGTDSTTYQPANPNAPVIKSDYTLPGVKSFTVTYPNGTSFTATGEADLMTKISEYSKGLLNSVTGQIGSQVTQGLGQLSQYTSDRIDDELTAIIGESVTSLMQGLQDLALNELQDMLSSVLQASPIGEVDSLKELIKDASKKQAKIDYQQYKVQYEDKKAHTELSSHFTSYYDKVDLYSLLQEVRRELGNARKILTMVTLPPAQRSALGADLARIGNLEAIVDDVKTITNTNGTSVWMSEAERVALVDDAQLKLQDRLQTVTNFKILLLQSREQQLKGQYRARTLSGMYADDTQLNRSVKLKK